MKKSIGITFLVFALAGIALAQAVSFPGLSAAQRKQLTTAKRTTPIVLPTWIPDGFKVEKVEMDLGPRVKIYDRYLNIIYSRKLADGKMQRFALEAGFDGLGGLPYDLTKTIKTPIGPVDLMYQPKDLDDESKRLMTFSMTEWFLVGKTNYHYNGMFGLNEDEDGGNPSLVMISLADTEKILKSLKRF